jgi:immune inhibitor A
VAVLLGIAALAMGTAPAGAVSVSPRVLEAARNSPSEAAALRERLGRYEASKAQGVDRHFPQFALDMARYPRGGVAHRNILVVLAQFPGEAGAPARAPSAASTPFYYHRLLFSEDPNDNIISLREYYKTNSHGRLVVSGSVTPKWVMMPHSYRYYANGASGLDFAGYPRSSQRVAEDAMAAAYSELGGNLGSFDNDGPDGVASSGDDDGYIDAVLVIHPGRGAEIIPQSDPEDPNWALWSHEAGITQFTGCDGLNSGADCIPGFQLGSVKGFIYVLLGEYSDFPADYSVGTYCHEFGHTLGLVDLYDPNAAGLGFFSLMALGNYLPYEQGKVLGSNPGALDAWSRQYLGFDPPNVAAAPGQYKLAPVTEGGGSVKVWTNGEPGTEYFLVEYRKKTGPDRYLPGDGLIVYHVDDRQNDNLSGPGTYRVSLVQADSLNPLQLESPTGNFGDAADPFPGTLGKRSITADTSPNTRSLTGADTGIRIWNIFAGSADNADTASFDLAISDEPALRVAGVTMTDGGGDGYPDTGETVDLTVTLRNAGLTSGPVAVTLTTLDPAVTVTDGSSSAAPIAGGATGTITSPFTLSIGTPASLPHDVSLTLAWNDGSSSGTQTILITIGMGSGLAEDFESGALGWSHAAVDPTVSTADEWHLSASRYHGGATSMKIGSTNPLGNGTNEDQTYAADEDAALVSPAFDLPATSELVFWTYVDAETNGGTGAWDGGRVEISMNGGEWVPLAIDGGYDYMVEFNSSAALRGADVLSGSQKRWRRMVADLTPYSGFARVRFRFASDQANDPRDLSGAQLRPYEGWYVDDLLVQSRTGGGPIPRHISFRAGPNPYRLNGPSSGSVQFRFSAADGLPKPGERPVIRIYDVRGREVGRTVATANPLAPAEFQASWSPRSEGGSNLGSGIYFARVDFAGRTESARLVLVR